MSQLQAPDKEATVRFSVDMSESVHRKLSMLAAKTERKKGTVFVDVVAGWIEGNGRVKVIVLPHHGSQKAFQILQIPD